MDVFDIHGEVIADYRSFTSSFVDIRNERIRRFDLGWLVIRIRHDDDWQGLIQQYPSVFGGTARA